MARRPKKKPTHGGKCIQHLRERLWKYRGQRITFWYKPEDGWLREMILEAGAAEENLGFHVSGIYLVVLRNPGRIWMYLSKALFRNEKGEKIGIRWFSGRRMKRGHSSSPASFDLSHVTFPIVEGALISQRGFQQEVSLYAEELNRRGCAPNSLPSFHSPTRAERLSQRML